MIRSRVPLLKKGYNIDRFYLPNDPVQSLFSGTECPYDYDDGSILIDKSPLASRQRRALQRGRCYDFNGTSGYLTVPSISMSNTDDFTLEWYYDFTGNATTSNYVYGNNSANNYFLWGSSSCELNINGLVYTFTWGSISSNQARSGKFTITVGANLAISWRSLDDALSRDQTFSYSKSSFSITTIAKRYTSDFLTGKLWGFSVSKNGSLYRFYRCDEQSGSTAYDSSGSGNHGTIESGITHSTQDTISYQNNVGYTLSGSVYIPRDESQPTKDVLGNSLQYSGRSQYYGKLVNSNCLYLQTGAEIEMLHLTGSETLTYDGTATLSVSSGKITVPSGGTVWNLQISDGSLFPCSEGCGDIIHDVSRYGSLVVSTPLGQQPQTSDLSGGLRYGRVTGNTLVVSGLTCDIDSTNSTYTIISGGTFDTSVIFPNSFVYITGLADAFTNRRYHIKSITSTVLTMWGRIKRSVTGATPTFNLDLTWGRTQDDFHWNLKKGFTQSGMIKIPAKGDGSNTDARNSLPLSCPPGYYHNMAETEIDFTGGVATPESVKYGWETRYVFQGNILDENAWCRNPPNYSNQVHAFRESDYITYPRKLTRDEQAELLRFHFNRWGRVWSVNGFGRVKWVDLDSILDSDQIAGTKDSSPTIAPYLLNTNSDGAQQHVILYCSSKIDLRCGVDAGTGDLETPLVVGNNTQVTALNGVRFNMHGAPEALGLWLASGSYHSSGSFYNISLVNLHTVVRGSNTITTANGVAYPRQEAITLEDGYNVKLLSNKIHGLTYAFTGFSLRTRNVVNGTEWGTRVLAGTGNGSDARHWNERCSNWDMRECYTIGGDDGFSLTIYDIASNETCVMNNFTISDSIFQSRNNSALKIMYNSDADVSGVSITDVKFVRCYFGTSMGASGTIQQPYETPVPSQVYDAPNAASVYRRSTSSYTTAGGLNGTISGIVFHECSFEGYGGVDRVFNLANLTGAYTVRFSNCWLNNSLSWGIHLQNCHNMNIGTLNTRFDAKSLAGSYGGNGVVHLGVSATKSNSNLLYNMKFFNHSRSGYCVSVSKGDSNELKYCLAINTVGRVVTFIAGGYSNVASYNGYRSISASGFSNIATTDVGPPVVYAGTASNNVELTGTIS